MRDLIRQGVRMYCLIAASKLLCCNARERIAVVARHHTLDVSTPAFDHVTAINGHW